MFFMNPEKVGQRIIDAVVGEDGTAVVEGDLSTQVEKICFVFPARNEGETIFRAVEEVIERMDELGIDYHFIVVDE